MATEVIPDYLLGVEVNCSIYPATNLAGALSTVGTAVPLTGVLESIDYLSDPEEQEVSGMAAGKHNWVNLKEDNSYTMTELMETTTDGTSNILRGWAMSTTYGLLVVSAGGKDFAFWGKRGRYTEHYDKGPARATLVMRYVGTVGDNPTITDTP